MAPSTAVLFALYGLAVVLRAQVPLRRGTYRIGVAVTSAGALVGLLLFFVSLLGIRPEAEHLGFPAAGTVGGVVVGHMSPLTAAGFVLASVSFLASLPSGSSRPWRARAAWGTAFLLIAAFAVLLLAYLYGTPFFYTGTFIPPAATTSVAFAALGVALLVLAGQQAGPTGITAETPAWVPYPLVLVFLLLAAGLATVGGLFFRKSGALYRREVGHQLAAIAELKASELARWRVERLGDGSILLENRAFSALVRRALDHPQDKEGRSQLREWLGKVEAHYEYDRVFLLDARGVERMSVPESRGPISSTIVERTTEILRSRSVAFQDFYRDEHDQRVYLTVLVPILEGRGASRVLGIVGLRIDPEAYLYPFIRRWPVPSRTSEVVIARRDGADVLFLNELRFRAGTALKLRVPLARQDVLAVKAALGQTGIVECHDYRGVPAVAAVTAVPGSPWLLVARMDADEVNAPLRERLWMTIMLVCGLVAAAAGGVGALWRERHLRHLRERYEAERERAWLQDVIARSLDEIYVFDPETFQLRFVNRGACRNIGYTEEELAELTPLDTMPELTAEALRALLQPLRAGARVLHVFETVHRRKDGSRYPVEVHLQLVDTGAGAVSLAIVADITERQRAETSIRHLNRVYAVLSDINEAIVRVRDMRVLFAEACRIAVEDGGFRLAWLGLVDPEAKRIRPVARAGVMDGDPEMLQVGFDAEPPGPGPTAGAPRDDRHVVCNDIAHDPRTASWRDEALARGYRAAARFPLRADGETVGTFNLYADEVGFFDTKELRLLDELAMDLSFAMEVNRSEEERGRAAEALRAAEEQLRFAQKLEAIGTLAGGIAHDFNNLLGAALGLVEITRLEAADSAPLREHLKQLTETLDRGRGLTRQLLAFGRRQRLEMRAVDLDVLVLGVTTMLERLLGENVRLVLLGADRATIAMADPGQIEQVVVNLCLNARDAMPDGGTLRIRTEVVAIDAAFAAARPDVQPGRYVRVSVTDTGIGMDEALRSRIFEPFFTTKGLGHGTGLGLSVAFGIVKQHRGWIDLESAPGRGTTFQVYLPHYEGPRAPDAAPAAKPATALPKGTETVLIAEDEASIRRTSGLLLERLGYRVLAASDGEEALRILAERGDEVRLVVSDVSMPRMGGRQLRDAVRERYPQIRFLFATGYSAESIGGDGLTVGPDELIMKPYTLAELAAAVRRVLDALSQASRA